MMDYTVYDFAGNIGVALIIVTYLLLQLGKMKSVSFVYSFLNTIGAALVIFSLMYRFNLSAFIVEVFWLVISLVGIIRFIILKRQDTSTNSA